jgi:stage V sporulation protein B
MIFSAIQSVQTGALLAAGRPTAPSINLIIGMVVKYFLNYVLVAIPQINVKGAIISTAVGYIIAIMLNKTQIKQCYKFKTYHIRMMVKPTFASIIMGVACIAVYFVFDKLFVLIFKHVIVASDIAIMIAVAAGIIVYFVVMIVIKAVKKADILGLPMGSKMYGMLSKFSFLKARLDQQ